MAKLLTGNGKINVTIQVMKKFEDECEGDDFEIILSHLNHPNIVEFYGLIQGLLLTNCVQLNKSNITSLHVRSYFTYLLTIILRR